MTTFSSWAAHSLAATQLLVRIRSAFGVTLPLASLFDRPTVAQMAHQIRTLGPQMAPRIEKGDHATERPVSFSQERVLFLLQEDERNRAYEFQATLRLRGPLNPVAVERALTEIVNRHEIFRTTFAAHNGVFTQIVHEYFPALLTTIKLQPEASESREEALARTVRECAKEPFALDSLPLVRWTLIQVMSDR